MGKLMHLIAFILFSFFMGIVVAKLSAIVLSKMLKMERK